MLPPGLSAEEGSVPQQRPTVNESSFTKDPLSSAVSSSCRPHMKSSRSSTLCNAEENSLTNSADAASSVSPHTNSSHRLPREREWGQTQHGVEGESINGTSCATVEQQAHQQQGRIAALASPRDDLGETTIAPDCLQTSSRMTSDPRAVTPPLVTTYSSSAARNGSSPAIKESSGAVSQACRTAHFCPPSLQRNPSITTPAERKSNDFSPNDRGTGTVEGLLHATASRLIGSTNVSSVSDNFRLAAAPRSKDAPAQAAQPRAADALVEEEPHHSAPADDTKNTCIRRDTSEDLHEATPINSAVASPREQNAGCQRRGRLVKEENAMEVITRVDAAVEVLVAHAEEQAEQIKRLTMLVEDLSLKVENLQERLPSGYIKVHSASPAAAEVPSAAGVPEVRQSRGRMVPPPLPRDKAREPYYGAAADQQGFPPSVRHGNNAVSESSTTPASYIAAQREAEYEALERRRLEEQREAQRREEERLRREEEERKRREELARRAAEEQRRREALDEKRKNIISSLISNKGGNTLFGDDGGAASHRSLFDD